MVLKRSRPTTFDNIKTTRVSCYDNMSLPIRQIGQSSGLHITAADDAANDYLNRPLPNKSVVRHLQRQAKETSARIFTQYHCLHEILSRHEETIQRRWAKKKRQQRQQLLLRLWPGMSAKHRPDVDALWRRQTPGKARVKEKDAFMWPCINQEDLCESRNLLLLLNTRGGHPPWRFARADLEAMCLGRESHAISKPFLDHHTMLLNVASENDYGKFVPWASDPNAFQWFKNFRQFTVNEGLMVLECQAGLLDFLVKVAKTILHDIPESALLDETYQQQPAPVLASFDGLDGAVHLSVIASEAPYRPPFQFDLTRVETMLAAHASAKCEHRWSVREDPGYFAECVLQYREHRPENIPGVDGSVHPWLSKGLNGMFGGAVLFDVLNRTRTEALIFAGLHVQVKGLQAMHNKHVALFDSDQPLPAEYIEECVAFEAALQTNKEKKLEQLKYYASSSPQLRSCFVREIPDDPGTPHFAIYMKDSLHLYDVKHELVYILQAMWEVGAHLQVMHLHIFLDEMDRRMRSESKTNSLISSFVAELLDDLGVIEFCLRQVYLHLQEVDNRQGVKSRDTERLVNIENASVTRTWHSRYYDTEDLEWFEILLTLGDPADGKFYYPIDKRRARDTVEALRKAERALSTVWMFYYQELPTTSEFCKMLIELLRVRRTPKWIEPDPGGPEDSEARSSSDAHDVPLSELYAELERRTAATVSDSSDIDRRKPKLKTKGVSNASLALNEAFAHADIQDYASQRQTTIAVNRRAFKTFRALFFDPSVTSMPGEVPWKDFIHAMTSIGFLAEKLYGSAW